jgi:hypothetical protein
MILNKDQILEADDLQMEPVDVPEWGGSVMVRTMTGSDRDAFDESLVPVGEDGNRHSDTTNIRVKLLTRAIVDEAGNRMFSAADMEALGRKSSVAIERVYAVAQRLNYVGAQAEAAAAKNSASGQSSDSGTASPDTSASPSESVSAA